MKDKAALTIILLIFIVGCTETKKTDPAQSKSPVQELTEQVKKEYKALTVSVTKNGAVYDINVTYVPTEFKYKSEQADKQAFVISNYQKIDKLSKSKHKVGRVTVTAITQSSKRVANPAGQLHIISQGNDSVSREAARFSISMEELAELKSKYEDPQYKVAQYATFFPFFLVELKLKSSKAGIKNLLVGESLDNDTNMTFTEIFYEPTIASSFGTRKDDKLTFENDFADIIKYSFESDPNIGKIKVVAHTDFTDTRGHPTSTIASYTMNRRRYEQITSNWDDFRFNIYKEISYSPIFLADLLSTSRIESMQYNNSVEINASFDPVTSLANAITTMEEDAVNIIYGLLQNDKNLTKVKVRFRGMIPVSEIPLYLSNTNKVLTGDGANQILSNFLVVEASRAEAGALNTEKLTAKQIVHNLNGAWDPRVEELNIRNSLGVKKEHFRKISLSGSTLSITLDACAFAPTGKAKRDSVISAISSLANTSIYKIHPPYITGVDIAVEKVFLDQAGNEQVTSLGAMGFNKDAQTNYWFQTSQAPKWLVQYKNTISVNENLTICQQK